MSSQKAPRPAVRALLNWREGKSALMNCSYPSLPTTGGPSDTAMVPYAIMRKAHHPEHIPPLTGMTPVSELTTGALDEDATLAMATLLSALKYATA